MTSPRGNSCQLSAVSFQLLAAGERPKKLQFFRQDGFTLMELMVVLAIVALVGGLSAGAFQLARRSYALSASASSIEAIIRTARNSAVGSGVPARVVIETNHATAYGFESIGEWSFENSSGGVVYGARSMPAKLESGASIGAGYVGQGLQLGSSGYADCGNESAFDFRGGVFAEAWVKTRASPEEISPLAGSSPVDLRRRTGIRPGNLPAPSEAAQAILSKGTSFFLGIAPDGALEGRIGDYRIRSMPGTVLPNRWTRIALSFDGEEMLLLADGIDRETYILVPGGLAVKEPAMPVYIPISNSSFRIGSSKGLFQGEVDEVRLYGMAEPVRHELGGRHQILGWKKIIRFDRNGRLDPRSHEVGVRVVLYDQEEASTTLKTTVRIDYSLTYEEWARRRGIEVVEGQKEAAEQELLRKIAGARRIDISVDLSGALR